MKFIWKLNKEFTAVQLWELYPVESFTYNRRTYTPNDMVAWIEQRNHYCDRGHWKGTTELGSMDFADSWPNYYMSLQRAKWELEEFTRWRVAKIRSLNEYEYEIKE